jgi:hypothetical protein
MPTLTVTHEAPLELIRQHPDLAVDLVQAMTSVPVPAGGRARLGPTDANSVVPAQFTADSVVIVDDPDTGQPALDMESEAGAARVLDAIRDTGASAAQRKRLTAIILKRASRAARRHLEELMKTGEYKDDFIESYVKVGIERGAVADAAEKLLKVLDVRGLQVTDAQRAQVTGSTDLAQLNKWFDRAITAQAAAEVFKD